MLDVTRLRVLEAVSRLGSVTAAAKELHYTQPTVSHHLARLEVETGAQLLQRAGRGIRLWRSSGESMPRTPSSPRTWG
jgi:DNA-binding transcriptional LysR family regulator